eukprot:TRINITY_DN49180_c0_g1_i11.p2 TRINITY_DN49180_c0_g1~~TRINITY_DN49180_c0_g1_i11.p2  ORF type:complete len:291 (+),score=5.05 TRINITY_DN49180_c0_g1_i11:289-1161(+)
MQLATISSLFDKSTFRAFRSNNPHNKVCPKAPTTFVNKVYPKIKLQIIAPIQAVVNNPIQVQNIVDQPIRTVDVKMPIFRSPVSSGMSLQNAMTIEKSSIKPRTNNRFELSAGEMLFTALFMCVQNPHQTITALTARIQPAANTGYLFHLSHGISTEYAIPNIKLIDKVQNSGKEFDKAPIIKLMTAVEITIFQPVYTLNSPEASGKYGLFTLSISISLSWLIPTMAMFISNAELRAQSNANQAQLVMISFFVAKSETDNILKVVPIIVCGRVNLQKAYNYSTILLMFGV